MSGDHAHVHAGSETRVAIAAALTGSFMLAEVAGGIISGSLALLADAGHMLTDFASLVLAWLGFRLARQPADEQRTYGFHRFSVLAAFVNGIALFAIAAWIVIEAVRRLREPPEVLGGLMLAVAAAGLVVNVLAFLTLQGGDKTSLNIRAATLHVAGDLLGSLAAIAAALVIIATGWRPADPILSILVALIILRAAWSVVKDAGRILMEAAPKDFDRQAVIERLLEISGVTAIEHVHVWAISETRHMATLEAHVDERGDPLSISKKIKHILHDEFSIGHATVETMRAAPGEPASGCIDHGAQKHS
ncbi:MAG: cation diffusion facilitator family transporter [Maricaulaceae bacterium]